MSTLAVKDQHSCEVWGSRGLTWQSMASIPVGIQQAVLTQWQSMAGIPVGIQQAVLTQWQSRAGIPVSI